MTGPLEGIKVLDMGAFSVGPQGCSILGLLGAEVIRIEPDYGDGLMRITPYINGIGTTYLNAHHNEKSIILGLKSDKDKEVAYQLVKHMDILVENRRAGALDRLGFGYDTVSKINPRIIYASSAAYGHTGPFLKYGGADHYIQAMSGFVSLNGQLDGPAEWLRYIAFVDGTGSATIAQGCLVGLVQREITGRGQYIDLDEFSSSLFMQSTKIAEYFATGQEPRRLGSESSTVCPSKAYLTQDGKYILVSALTPAHWVNLCSALEMKDLAGDPRFANNRDRIERREEVNSLVQAKIQDKPLLWWQWQLARFGVPHSKVMGPEEIVQDRFYTENKYVVELPSAWGPLKYQNLPWRFHETPLSEMTASPYMDGDRDYVLNLVGSEAAPVPDVAQPVAKSQPLEKMKVIDFTSGLVGPACTAVLGTLGAEVVKVERASGDYSRKLGPMINGESAIFLQLNHDKKSICINFDEPESLDVIRALVKTADIVVEDFKPGEAESLGVGYDDLSLFRRDLIYCSIRPFWDKGPSGNSEATELELQGLSGLMRWIGELGKEPVRLGADIAASSAGNFVFSAIMAAIYNKQRRHKGERIIVSELAAILYLAAHALLPMSGTDNWDGFWVTGPYDPAQTGFRTRTKPIMFGMMTKGDDQARATFQDFCKAIGLENMLQDAHFVGDCYRTLGLGRDIAKWRPLFEKAFATWDADALVALVDRCGGLAAPLLTFSDLYNPLHDQVKANNLIIEQEHPRAGKIKLVNNAWRYSVTLAEIKRPAPALGEHTDEILSSIGYSRRRSYQT